MALLVALDEGVKRGLGRRDVAQAHAPTDLHPEVEARLALVRGHGPTRVHPAPAQRKLDEGPQHEQVVVVGDAVVRMRAVDAVERLRAHLAVPARLQKMADQQAGVVVALLTVLAELAGAVQQGGHRIAAIGVEQRQLQRALHVPGHVVLAHQAHDALAIGTRVQRGNGARHLGVGEQAPALAKRFGHRGNSLACTLSGSVAPAPAGGTPIRPASGMPRGENTSYRVTSPESGNTLIRRSSSCPGLRHPGAAQAYSRPRSRPWGTAPHDGGLSPPWGAQGHSPPSNESLRRRKIQSLRRNTVEAVLCRRVPSAPAHRGPFNPLICQS